MPHYGVLHEYKFDEEVDDLRGAEVYGVNNENLGKIADVIFDHSNGEIRHVVLKTGGLLSHHKKMVPASRISRYGNREDKFYAEIDKERLEMLPEFDGKMLKEDFDWANYEKDYEKRWNDGVVMYNKDTGRIVTPPLREVEGTRNTPLNAGARESLQRDFTPEKLGKQDDYLGVASGTGKTTLEPRKASKPGKEETAAAEKKPTKKVMSPMGAEIEIPSESTRPLIHETIREPGVYKLNELPERELIASELSASNKGRYWAGFQERLRSRRDRIVVDCPRCASQEKVA